MKTLAFPVIVLLGMGCTNPASKDGVGPSDTAGPSRDDTGAPSETGETAGTDDTAETDETADTRYVSDADAIWAGFGSYGGYDLETADLDGDGCDELFVPAYVYDWYTAPSPEFRGQVVPGASALASSSRWAPDWDGVVTLYNDLFLGEEDIILEGTFGPIGDIDGDGTPDVAFPQPTLNEGPFVFSGATLSTSRFPDGEAYTSDADLTLEGDASSGMDVYRQLSAIGAPTGGGTLQVAQGDVWAFPSTIYLFPLPVLSTTLNLEEASATISASSAIASSAELDVDGDGTPELLDLFNALFNVTSSKPMTLDVFDLPADGASITDDDTVVSIEDPIPSGVDHYDKGAILLPGDLDGDGLDDLVMYHQCHDATSEDGCNGIVAGLTSLSSLVGSAELDDVAAWSISGVEVYSHVGRSVALVPDVDGDAIQEIFASAARRGDYDSSYSVYLSTTWRDGGSFGEDDATRTYLGNYADNVDWAVSAGDLDGDGNPEWMIQLGPYTGGAWIFSW